MAAFVALMVFGTTRSMVGVSHDFEYLADQTLETTRLLEDMRAAVLQIVSSSSEIALVDKALGASPSGANSDEVKEEIAREARQKADAIQTFRRDFAAYSALVDQNSPDHRALRDVIGNYARALIAESDTLISKMRQGAPREVILVSKERLEALEVRTLGRIVSALTEQHSIYKQRETALRGRISETRFLAWWGLAMVTIAIALLGILTNRRITGPLGDLTGAAERLATGDLNARVSHTSKDELGVLAKTFNRMTESLKVNIEHREAAEERLHEAQKLKAIGQLTGGISHDFNNILAVIMGNAQLVRENNPGIQLKQVDAIERAAHRGAELTQRLLAYSRRQPLAPRAVALPQLITEMEDMLRHSLGQSIEVETNWTPDLWAVTADPGQVESALLNLALNARHAMSGGGRFSIQCTNIRVEDGVVDDPDITPGDYVSMRVADTGTGMTKDVARQAFEPFFTTKDFGSGSGLGLSMVYGFVKQTGGAVTLDSEPGRGTTITIYLPRAEQPTGDASLPKTQSAPEGRGEKILVLEDEQQVLDMVRAMLEGLGYDVRGALTVDAAKEILKAGRVDLVLSDVVLNGDVSGPEFVKQIRQHQPDLKVVFMSGFAADQPRSQDGIAGSDVLLQKPFQRRDLAATLHRALN